jgi:hypothetical protein
MATRDSSWGRNTLPSMEPLRKRRVEDRLIAFGSIGSLWNGVKLAVDENADSNNGPNLLRAKNG